MMGRIVLQACGMESWINGDWRSCIFDPVTGLIGDAAFGLLVASGLYFSLYLAGGGDIRTPTVVSILLGGALFTMLPGAYTGLAQSLLVIGIGAVFLQIAQRYILDPSTQ